MVKLLKLPSPFRSDDHNSNNHGGKRRSQRIQQQQLERERQLQLESEQLLAEAMENNRESKDSKDRIVPGQRRSFDDIDSANAPPGFDSSYSMPSAGGSLRKIFSGSSNKKSRRSTSAGTNNSNAAAGGGVIRRATTIFRPSSSSGRRVTETTFASSTMSSFEAVEGMDTSDCSTGSLKQAEINFDVTMTGPVKTLEEMNVLDWLQTDAPTELLPKILSFCGSRKVNALSKVNKTLNEIVKNESVWKVMCEDTHKWNQDDEIPKSWLQHYKQNPCLPFDYDSIDAAFEAISSGPRKSTKENGVKQHSREQRKSTRILLQPGPYFLRRPLVCNVTGNAEVIIECIKGKDPKHGMVWERNFHQSVEATSPEQRVAGPSTSSILKARRPSSAMLREVFGCRFPSPTATSGQVIADNGNEDMAELIDGIRHGNYRLPCIDGPNPTAFLIFDSRRENEPCVRVKRGSVTLRGLKFMHYAGGKDIWNGNAAIQVQAPFDGNRLIPINPKAHVIDCDIRSMSGRGIVSIDGGVSRVDNCYIHNNAATGLYLGGIGSMATITRTDVFENGNGNALGVHGNRTEQGHSGIYVEQGVVKIRDCNISKNSLTGVSGISEHNATLHVENSELKSNGSVQLELPPHGSPSRERSFSRGNNISILGQGNPRSRFLQETLRAMGDGVDGPIGGRFRPMPQSPSEFPHDFVARVAVRAAI